MKKSIYTSLFLALSLMLSSCGTSSSQENSGEIDKLEMLESSAIQATATTVSPEEDEIEANIDTIYPEEPAISIKEADVYIAEKEDQTLEDATKILNYFVKDASSEELKLQGGSYDYTKDNINLQIQTIGGVFYSKDDIDSLFSNFGFIDITGSSYKFNPTYQAGQGIVNLKKAYPLKELSFMSFDDAKALAETFLKDLNFTNYTFKEAYSMDKESAEKILKKKQENYTDTPEIGLPEEALDNIETYCIKFQSLLPNQVPVPLLIIPSGNDFYGNFNGEAKIYINKNGIVLADIGANWNFKKTGESVEIIDQETIEQKIKDYSESHSSHLITQRAPSKLIALSLPHDTYDNQESFKYVYIVPYKGNHNTEYLIFDASTGELLPIKNASGRG